MVIFGSAPSNISCVSLSQCHAQEQLLPFLLLCSQFRRVGGHVRRGHLRSSTLMLLHLAKNVEHHDHANIHQTDEHDCLGGQTQSSVHFLRQEGEIVSLLVVSASLTGGQSCIFVRCFGASKGCLARLLSHLLLIHFLSLLVCLSFCFVCLCVRLTLYFLLAMLVWLLTLWCATS